MTLDLTTDHHYYYYYLTTQDGPKQPLNVTAYLTRLNAASTRYVMLFHSTSRTGGKVRSAEDRRHAKQVLEPKVCQELADLAIAAGWRPVSYLNTHQVLVSEWLPPWHEGPNLPDDCYAVSMWPRSVISPPQSTLPRSDIPPQPDDAVYDRAGIKGFIVTGNLRACTSPEGCTGSRVLVQWPEGRRWECTKAMFRRPAGVWQFR